MVFRKLLILLLFAYTANSFSMLYRLRNYLKKRQTKTGQTKHTRQTRTSKKQGSFSGFGKKTEFKDFSQKTEKTFSPLKKALFTTTALVPLVISDEEKKEDHEKLKELLSQESFDQSTKEEI